MKLKTILPKKSGRSVGKLTVRHQGGRMKRFLREVDFKRNRIGIWGRVEEVEYDPNRNADLARIVYENGDRGYIIAPQGLKIGMRVISSDTAPLEVGNCLSLAKIPVGTGVYSLEIKKGMGGQIAHGAGTMAVVFGKDETHVLVKMPSGEIRKFAPELRATIGQVGNIDAKHKKRGKAGIARRQGIRPTVRGVAMHPDAHPHGGGEGRSRVGLKYPKTPWGKKAVGKTRKRNKYSDKLIVQRRKKNRRG